MFIESSISFFSIAFFIYFIKRKCLSAPHCGCGQEIDNILSAPHCGADNIFSAPHFATNRFLYASQCGADNFLSAPLRGADIIKDLSFYNAQCRCKNVICNFIPKANEGGD